MLLGKLLDMLFLVVFLTPKYWLYFESFWLWNASLLYSLQNNTLLHYYIMIYRQHLSWNYIITVKIIVQENLVHILKSKPIYVLTFLLTYSLLSQRKCFWEEIYSRYFLIIPGPSSYKALKSFLLFKLFKVFMKGGMFSVSYG